MESGDRLYLDNLRLGQIEYKLQRLHLESRPRCLGLVLSNRCNIGCIHCYQSKNGDNLLRPTHIGEALRREFMAFYPYLSTLRLQGGELFAIPGFSELLDDVAQTVSRPIVSISTNATLIDEDWAERIVRAPFQNVTISIDAGTPETFARLRRGAHLESVLANVRRILRWKKKLGSQYPYLDSFFVIMRSNIREIPQYLEMIRELEIRTVSLQTVQINAQNLARFPTLADDEAVASKTEVRELHALLTETLAQERSHFDMIRISGLTTLFEEHGLDTAFLDEGSSGLYPDSDDLHGGTAAPFELCPNPWTTLFVVENGDVHLCFLSEPIGNLYEAPLAEIWNSPRAIAKRSRMVTGRYLASGCSTQWCSWREGKTAALPVEAEIRASLAELSEMIARPPEVEVAVPPELLAARRIVASRERRIAELEGLIRHERAEIERLLQRNSDETEELLRKAQRHIDHLEDITAQAARGFEEAQEELRGYRDSRLVRIAHKASRALRPKCDSPARESATHPAG